MLRGQIMALCAALLSAAGTSLYNKMGEKLTSDMIGYVRMFLAVPMSLILVFIFDRQLPAGYPLQTYAVAFGSGFVGILPLRLLHVQGNRWSGRQGNVRHHDAQSRDYCNNVAIHLRRGAQFNAGFRHVRNGHRSVADGCRI